MAAAYEAPKTRGMGGILLSVSYYVILISWAIGFVALAKQTWPEAWKIMEDDSKILMLLMYVLYMVLLCLWPLGAAWNMCADIRNFVSQKFRRS